MNHVKGRPVPTLTHALPREHTTPAGIELYYTLDDALFCEAAARGFAWTVHRPHTIIGSAPGNAMNICQTRAVSAALCCESGEAFIFPGSHEQWNALTDVTDVRVLAQQLAWAATSPTGAWSGVQHFERRPVPVALALAADY